MTPAAPNSGGASNEDVRDAISTGPLLHPEALLKLRVLPHLACLLQECAQAMRLVTRYFTSNPAETRTRLARRQSNFGFECTPAQSATATFLPPFHESFTPSQRPHRPHP